MTTLQALESKNPELRPWLAVVGVVMRELENSAWDVDVPVRPVTAQRAHLLDSVAPRPDSRALTSLFEKLRRAAIRSELPALGGWNGALDAEAGAMAVFDAALRADGPQIAGLAATARVDAGAFAAVAGLLPMPFLHACRRAWSGALPAWSEGFCPCCGAWPGFAEVCGVERARLLRCLRCASSWPGAVLHCAYCGNADHERMGVLRAEDETGNATLDVCEQCKGYLKVFNRLGPTPPVEVMACDLASVSLDVAAARRGYRRPAGLGRAAPKEGVTA